jgi:hypothetical protein
LAIRAIATEEILVVLDWVRSVGSFLNRKKANVLVVYPNKDLAVRLTYQFAFVIL